MPKIYDNIENHLTKGLNESLEVSQRTDFCVGYFNLRGWKQVADNIDKFSGEENNRCRLLVGMQKLPRDVISEYFINIDKPIDNAAASKIKKQLAVEFRNQLTIGIPTEEDELGLRKLGKQLKDNKVVVKLFLRHALHAKLYLAFREDKINPIIGYLGSSNLTLAGLVRQGELNIDVLDRDAAEKLAGWFEDRWKDRWCIDITQELIEIIEESWAGEKLIPPYHIYLKIAYHLSIEARAGLQEFKIPRIFHKDLLEFQEKAVLIAAHHLNKRNGVMIGDVVGLGKTIIAITIAKMFEEDLGMETLIICPVNIIKMWKKYADKYELKRVSQILPISQVQTKLPSLRRYRLVIIDESHNLRNREGKRYRAINEYIQENDSMVVLLTATPYNKDYLDLSSQLRLFIPEDKDLGISPENYITKIGGKVEFAARHQHGIRSLPAFEKSDYTDDWRELMRLYLVRRTRSFIKGNYARYDPVKDRKYLLFSNGDRSYFPDRIPKKMEYEFDPDNPADQYAKLYSTEVVNIINQLELVRYGLGNYLDEKSLLVPTPNEKVVIENLARAGKRLIGFSRTGLFKRLESSGYSFLLSISRHILRNFIFVYAIENNLPFSIGSQEANMLDEFLEDEDPDSQNKTKFLNLVLDEETYLKNAEEIYQIISQVNERKKYQWISSGLFLKQVKTLLIEDARKLIEILKLGKDWNADEDRQLNALHDLCSSKHAKEKIIVFTQFADTAHYLFEQLKKRGIKRIECATGESEDPTDLAYRFSPVSNEVKKEELGEKSEIRVLITTDVLSEGQNLQDGYIVVNYDLPWAIIRLIQRTGRVDRIGQKSEQILCYSFLPEDGIERIIGLRRRLTRRIRENAEVVGSDEVFFEGDPVNISDLYNEKAGILDDEDDGEVDLASYAYQIWKNAIDDNPKLQKIIPEYPDVIYSTRKAEISDTNPEGVIVYTKTADDNDVLTWIDTSNNIITQSQLRILKTAACKPETIAVHKLPEHHKLVATGVEYIKDTESDIGGQLGKKTGARYRVYMRLNSYYREYQNTLFANENLKRAIDEIYKYPLREYARDSLNRWLKTGIDDQRLAELIVALREEGRLCIIDKEELENRPPKIICSLGLKA